MKSDWFDEVSYTLGGLRGVCVGPADEKLPFHSEGTTVKLKDGTLWHAFNLRYGEADMSEWHPHYARTVIARVASMDQGRTWSAPEVLFESNTGINASHPAIRRLANGDLGASYQRINTLAPDKWDRKDWLQSLTTADKIFRWSADDGRTWSPEIVISPTDGYWTSAHDRMLVLSTGRILQPLHSHPEKKKGVHISRMAWSDDHGRTWSLGAQDLRVDRLAPGYIGPKESNFHEVAIAEREDGSVYMIGRTSAGRLYACESQDRGETWSEPEPTPILSPESPANVMRFPDSGDFLLVWNSQCVTNKNRHLGQRLTLASVVSRDGGRTWGNYREFLTIPPDQKSDGSIGANRICYPSIFFDDGLCYLGYWAGARCGDRELDQQYVATIPIGWFTALEGRHEPQTVGVRGWADQWW